MRWQLVYPELGVAELRETEDPPLPERGARLETRYSALSPGTERNQLLGGNYNRGRRFPHAPGYQAVSQVVEVAPGCPWKLGDILITGSFGTHASHHVLGPDALAIAIPATADLVHAPYCSLAAVAWHDVSRLAPLPGERCLIIGDGILGQFCVQAAHLRGADVVCLGSHADRLALARSFGATAALSRHDAAAVAALGQFDSIVDTAGADLSQVIGSDFGGPSLIKRSGRLMMTAGREQIAYSSNAAQGRRITIHHAAHYDPPHLHAVTEAYLAGRFAIAPCVREIVPWRDSPSIYDRLRDDPRSLLGVIFTWT